MFHASGFTNPKFYIMEYVDDCSDLSTHKDKQHKTTITRETAYQILREQASDLSYLRKKNLVHHDIKPANILFSPRGSKLIDFGHYTEVGSSWRGGTPGYLPLEYTPPARNLKATCRLDIFALGVIGYWLVGARPLPMDHWILNNPDDADKHRKYYKQFEKYRQDFEAQDDCPWLANILSSMCFSKRTPDTDTIHREFASRKALDTWAIMKGKYIVKLKHS